MSIDNLLQPSYIKSDPKLPEARIYQVNSYLRRLGLEPTPPGKSALKDRIKIFALGLLSDRRPKSKFMILRSGVLRLKSMEGKLKQFINKIVKKI
ncbi:hypothetical protein [Nostoc sp.]|uniref:hypothetical protein n=1 Tax=Nostoc sp. TaxID=1180 RepID=UPI002FF7C3DB